MTMRKWLMVYLSIEAVALGASYLVVEKYPNLLPAGVLKLIAPAGVTFK
jgi:hypothetical protein